MQITDIIIGIGISILVAGLAYLKRSLTMNGFLTATFLGTIIYSFGGVLVWSVLIAFFISSSLLTKLHEKKDQSTSKGRNYVQVLSNGLVASIFSILYYFLNLEILLLAAVVSISTSNADTWASEIGILSKGKTYHIVNWKIVPKGVSGAVSGLGTVASLIGALFIGLVFSMIYGFIKGFNLEILMYYGFIVTIGGFLGCMIDSYLGALLQAKYRGLDSGKLTEKNWLPNEKVVLASGLAIMTNDAVNLLSGLASAVLTVLLFVT
jgi:uncharacterized protein (TIGR00297 family)